MHDPHFVAAMLSARMLALRRARAVAPIRLTFQPHALCLAEGVAGHQRKQAGP